MTCATGGSAVCRRGARMRRLYREQYSDFTAKHFHEALRRQHNYTLGYTVTRLALQSAGLVGKAVRRSAHRKKRQRRPLPGMLLFQDGSTHRWLPGTDARQDLIVTLNDATGAIYSIFLIEEEGTQSSFIGLSEVIGRHGLFSAFYTSRRPPSNSPRNPPPRDDLWAQNPGSGPLPRTAPDPHHPREPARSH